jgi:PadR family transcriptional regulator PadR
MVMVSSELDNWKTQLRKGYLELCLLLIVRSEGKIYGLELIERLAAAELPTKEGTLYPILNRLTVDGILSSYWETQNVKGHPRKFYSLTKEGAKTLSQMEDEFEGMTAIFKALKKNKEK